MNPDKRLQMHLPTLRQFYQQTKSEARRLMPYFSAFSFPDFMSMDTKKPALPIRKNRLTHLAKGGAPAGQIWPSKTIKLKIINR